MNIIVSVGGSGAICVDVLHYLAYAGLLHEGDYQVLIMDNDWDCHSNTTCMSHLIQYKPITEKFKKPVVVSYHRGLFGRKDLEEIPLFGARFTIKDKIMGEAVKELAGVDGQTNCASAINRDKKEINEILLNMVLSNDEKMKSLKDGFNGHPSLGTALFDSVKETNSYNSSLLGIISTALKGGDNVRVFLVGSIFGGTGAALFPNIARNIREKFQGYGKLFISGALLLPFFSFPDNPNRDTQSSMDINARDFFKKSKTAIDYYMTQRDLVRNNANSRSKEESYIFDSLYLMGKSPLTQTCDHYAPGGGGQAHTYHVVHLYAALAACEFFNGKDGRQEGNQIYVPWISKDPSDIDVELNNLPSIARKRLHSFARFSVFMLEAFSPLVHSRIEDLKGLPLFKHIYSEAHGQAELNEADLRILRNYVEAVCERCTAFFSFCSSVCLLDLFPSEEVAGYAEGKITNDRDRELDLYLGIDKSGPYTPNNILKNMYSDKDLKKVGRNFSGDEGPRAIIDVIYGYCKC